MKCFETSQESQECDTQETNQVLQNNQNRFGNSFLNQMLSTEIDITGYASPEWNNPKGESPEELNESLAWERADSVEAELEAIFQSFLSSASQDIKVNNHGGVIANENDSKSQEDMRKADISIMTEAITPAEEIETIKPAINPKASRDWAIRIDVSGGGGGAGLAGGGLFASLKNLKTGEIADGFFAGLGIGFGGASPSVSKTAPEENWLPFQTQRFSTFEDFDGTPVHFTSATVGIGVLSASLGRISFVMMGEKAQNIETSDLNGIGGAGLDLSSLIGVFNLRDSTYQSSSRNQENTFLPQTEESQISNHEVSFSRGSAEISASEQESLSNLISWM